MKEVNDLHKHAMEAAEKAFLQRFAGNVQKSIDLFSEAYELESKAALLVSPAEESEPSRSVLFRSAASLALNAKRFRDAEIMASHGLIGNPPEEIVQELRNILEQVNLERHLDLRGLVLGEDELQLSLAGPEIGYGMVNADEFLKRIEIIEKLTFRTAERHQGLPFRERGQIAKSIRETYQPYFSVPRAASFSVTVRFGQAAKNYLLFEEEPAARVVDELIDNIGLVNDRKEEELKSKIPDPDYFTNFIALTKKLSPDIRNVHLVGLTSFRKKKEKRIALVRPGKEIQIPGGIEEKGETEKIEIIGRLEYASAYQNEVRLTDREGNIYHIVVPKSILSDIVKPYWEEVVRISGRKSGNKIYFEDIEKD